MAFPWLQRTPPRDGSVDRHAQAGTAELSSRAGVLHRLGFSNADAARRPSAGVAWKYGIGGKQPRTVRPDALSDAAIAEIVSDAFDGRPG